MIKLRIYPLCSEWKINWTMPIQFLHNFTFILVFLIRLNNNSDIVKLKCPTQLTPKQANEQIVTAIY